MYKFIIIFLTIFTTIYASITVNIKQNNVIKKISVNQNETSYTTLKQYKFKDDSFLSIKFNEITPEKLTEFENNYNLQLQQILIIGDYIYKHNNSNILQLIEQIIEENDNIKSITPLWSKQMNLR